MPRVVKSKNGRAAGAPAKKRAATKHIYEKPEPIPEGTVLKDLRNTNWYTSKSIGTGGFGEIYLARREREKNYDYVVKCEPSENGPLFVEMHFYHRNVQLDAIEQFKNKLGVKSLGIPYMLGNGSVVLNKKQHRFIVIPRYGNNIQKFIDENGGKLPEGTVYRLALQMLDVLEFIHTSGYVHGDLKALNILIGYGMGGGAQVYLVDYGLAARINVDNYKPDPKKAHNGTIEYTSRDAHMGITTKRSDLEILGYNLIEWLGGVLPWVKDNSILTVPVKVQQSKEKFMNDIVGSLMKIFPTGTPTALKEFMQHVASLKYEDIPNYDKCRKIFNNALKVLKIANSGDLQFKLKETAQIKKNNNGLLEESNILDSDDDDDYADDGKKPIVKRRLPMNNVKSPNFKTSRTLKTMASPVASKGTVRKNMARNDSPKKGISPKQQKTTPEMRHKSRPVLLSKTASSSSSSSPASRTPLKAQTNFNIRTASERVARSRSSSKPSTPVRSGSTIIRDKLTPPSVKHCSKTYEVNLELDISMDANIVVNVKRKKRHATASTSKANTPIASQSTDPLAADEEDTSPRTRAKLRKLNSSQSDSKLNPKVAKLSKKERK